MKSGNDMHLSEELLLLAVVDEKDLSGNDRLHIQECQRCQENILRLRNDFLEFGELAKSAVPALEKNITIPAEEQARGEKSLTWLPSFATAFITGLLLFVYFLGIETAVPKPPAFQSPEDLLAEERLMDEIFQIVENPLPEELLDFTGANESFDDDFLDFAVPDINGDFQS